MCIRDSVNLNVNLGENLGENLNVNLGEKNLHVLVGSLTLHLGENLRGENLRGENLNVNLRENLHVGEKEYHVKL